MKGANDGLWDWNFETDKVYYSPRWKGMLGYEEDELEDNLDCWKKLVHPDDKDWFLEEVQSYVDGRSNSFEVEMRMKHKDGHDVIVLSRAFLVNNQADSQPIRLVGTHVDITQRKKTETFEKRNANILEMIATGKAASAIYDEIALMYEDRHLGLRCSLLELHEGKLLHGGAPSMPKEYCEAVHGLKNGPHVGSCGASTYTGKRVLVEDIATDPKWSKLKDAALPHGMRCCWSEPIKNSLGKVLGAFGMYYNHTALPNDEESKDLKSAARLAGIIMERERSQQALQESELRQRKVVETALDGFWIVSKKGQLLDVNSAYIQMSGYTREELLAMHINDLEALESNTATAEHIKKIIDSGSDVFESKHRKKNGVIWAVEVTATYSNLDDGCFFVFLRDIYHRKLSEHLINLRNQLADTVFKGTVADVMTTTLNYAEKVTSSNIGFYHFVESDENTVSLQVWSSNTLKNMCNAKGEGAHYPVSDAGIWVDCIHKRKPIIHNDYPSLTYKKGMPEGHPALLRELTIPIFRYDKIVAVLGVGNKPVEYSQQDIEIVQQITDIGYDYVERKQADDHIEYLAYYDELTGLSNRTLLFDHINQAIAFSKRSKDCFALCFLDLDSFKPVNDRYGHEVGDPLLIEFTQRLTPLIRDVDSFCRLGGDEFVILLTQLPKPDDYKVIIERILNSVATPFQINDLQILVTTSIGITFYPQDNHDADTLLRHADQAMYKAKAEGKNRFYIHDLAYAQQIKESQEILKEVKTGLENNEFVLFYQPKVNMSNGEIIGLEALVRWNHPERGILAPGLFLPYLDDTIEEIHLGKWVLKKALEQIAQWQSEGLNIPVSVNVSAQQLQQTDFVVYISFLLKGYPEGIAHYLELEVLETSAIHDTSTAVAVMQQCSDLGIKFALDDFGTGYSSLTYFHRLPIDILKIDQHFVRDILNDPDDWKIVEGVISLATQYHRPVIAEGVESIEIAILLMYMGNTLMQGYVISKPMPVDKVNGWILDWKNNGIWLELEKNTYKEKTDFILQVAVFSHKRWVNQIIEYVLSNGLSVLPELSDSNCTFFHWYNGIGKFNYGTNSNYPFIAPKHEKVHQIAEQLINVKNTTKQKEKLIQSLHNGQDELVKALLLLSEQS